MKYIRTKDGRIFEKNDNLQIIDNTICNMQNGKVWLMLGEILKQADTIEELCDEFVLFRDNKPYAVVPNKEHNAELAKDMWKDYLGAIWTEWGLKYIAKINKKRELELL